MKLTKEKLKQIIKEELEKADRPVDQSAVSGVSEIFAKVENLIGSAHEEITALKDYERTSELTRDMTRNAKRIGYSIILMQAHLESFLGLESGGLKDYVGPLHRVAEINDET